MKNRRVDGDKLRNIRIRAQLRQTQLATNVGIRPDTLCHIEAGRYQPGDMLAHRLAQALNCQVEEFIATAETSGVAA